MAKFSPLLVVTDKRLLEKKIKKALALREKHRDEARKASALLKVLYDKQRAARKQSFRASMTKKVGGVLQKVGAPAKRGRKERWPGHCLACLMRHLKEDGGPRHIKSVCAKTKATIKASPRWVKRNLA